MSISPLTNSNTPDSLIVSRTRISDAVCSFSVPKETILTLTVFLFYSCALCTHFTVKYSENEFYASICTKNVQTTVLTVQVVRRCVFMVRMVHVAVV